MDKYCSNIVLKINPFSVKVCSNATRVFVHKSIIDDFVAQLVERTKAMAIGDPFSPTTQVGALISEEHYHRVKGYINQAISEVLHNSSVSEVFLLVICNWK